MGCKMGSGLLIPGVAVQGPKQGNILFREAPYSLFPSGFVALAASQSVRHTSVHFYAIDLAQFSALRSGQG